MERTEGAPSLSFSLTLSLSHPLSLSHSLYLTLSPSHPLSISPPLSTSPSFNKRQNTNQKRDPLRREKPFVQQISGSSSQANCSSADEQGPPGWALKRSCTSILHVIHRFSSCCAAIHSIYYSICANCYFLEILEPCHPSPHVLILAFAVKVEMLALETSDVCQN